MYTFKRPQQQQQQQDEEQHQQQYDNLNAGINAEAGVHHGMNTDVYTSAYTTSDMSGNIQDSSYTYTNNYTSLQQQQQPQPQQQEESGEGDPTQQTQPTQTQTQSQQLQLTQQTQTQSQQLQLTQTQTQQSEQLQLQQSQSLSLSLPLSLSPDGQLPEDVSAADALQHCRAMVLRSPVTPPPHWRRLRRALPASVAELHLTPSAPEPIQSTPSPSVVLLLENTLPDGMTSKEYAKSLVKYVVDLLAYQRAATAITSLRFVKIGKELSQLVVAFGRDVQLASLVLEEFRKVGLHAGFGAPMVDHNIHSNYTSYNQQHNQQQQREYDAPCATFHVTDYRLEMHNGTGITAEDITALLLPTRSPNDISVVEGYERGDFYVAVCRPETVYAWLWNPFCSFLVQRTLFERCGILITMADCPHSFLSRGSSGLNTNTNTTTMTTTVGGGGGGSSRKGLPYASLQQMPSTTTTARRRYMNYDGNMSGGYDLNNAEDSGFEEGDDGNEDMMMMMDGRHGGNEEFLKKNDLDDDNVNNNYNNNNNNNSHNNNNNENDDDNSSIGSHNMNGDRTAKSATLAWARNAKDEVDIFEGLNSNNNSNNNKSAEKSNTSLEFVDDVDDDMTKLLHNINKEKQQQQQEEGELGTSGVGSQFMAPIQPSPGGGLTGMPAMPMPLTPFSFPLQQQQQQWQQQQSLQQQSLQQQQQQYGYYFPLGGGGGVGGTVPVGGWQPQTTLPMGDPQSMMMNTPLPYGVDMGNMYEPVKEQKVKYPELVDDANDTNNNTNENNENNNSTAAKQAGDENFTSQGREVQQDQHQGSQQAMYWNRMGGQVVGGSGAGFYPMNPMPVYGSLPYAPPIQQQQQQPYSYPQHTFNTPMNNMPSILGQPKYISNSFYTGDDGMSGGNMNTNSNSGGISNNNNNSTMGVLPPPVLLSTPLAPPTSQPSTQPPVITVNDAYEWSEKLIELTQVAFSSSGEVDESKPDETTQAVAETTTTTTTSVNEDTSSELLFNHVPYTATVPPMAGEIEEIMTFLEEHYVGIKLVINSTDPEMQESRRRIITALLTRNSETKENSEEMDWVLEEKGTDAEGVKYQQLPALLPYLLTNVRGIEIISTLASQEPLLLLPLLTRYVLPFLLDAVFVQTVCVVALRAVPTANNSLVHRIIRHWGPLTTWLHAHIQSQAAAAEARAEIEMSTHTSASAQSLKNTTKTAVVRRLTSQVGNTIDILLAALSDEQRDNIREYLDNTNALVNFMKLLQSPEEEEKEKEKEKNEEEKEKEEKKGDGERESIEISSKITPSSLWSTEGAVHRSLLRLYLNANLFSGTVVVNTLFVPQASLTRDHYYFVLVAFSKSHVSPVLSKETACVCGAFLRLMEQKILSGESDSNNNNNITAKTDSSNTLPQVLTEKDAVHLMDAALRAVDSLEVYTCLRDAYFTTPFPTKRYTQVETKLSQTTPPAATQQSHHNNNNNTHKPQQDDDGHSSGVLALPTTGGSNSNSNSGWNSEWTVSMRNYPLVGDPFTPLPTGWTSALSRSYGHYYFKSAKGAATYRHPTDATEFMATPQAFLREPGVTTTLSEVLELANSTLANATTNSSEKSASITEEQAEKWLQDQRMRVEPLDMATLALLKITYRVGGATGRKSYPTTTGVSSSNTNTNTNTNNNNNSAGKSYRHRRDSSEENSHHHHHNPTHNPTHNSNNSNSTRKRGRAGCSLHPAELQRRLAAIQRGGYPPRGPPFPPLPRGWTCSLSGTSGLYYFRPPAAARSTATPPPAASTAPPRRRSSSTATSTRTPSPSPPAARPGGSRTGCATSASATPTWTPSWPA